MAAMGIRAGFQDLVVAGRRRIDVSLRPAQPGEGMAVLDGNNHELREVYPFVPQGISADLLATLEGIDRADCDRLPSPAATGGQGHGHRPVRPQVIAVNNPTARLPWITTSTEADTRPRGWPSSHRHSSHGTTVVDPYPVSFDEMWRRSTSRSPHRPVHHAATPRRGGRRLSHAAGLTRLRPGTRLEARARLVMGTAAVPNR